MRADAVAKTAAPNGKRILSHRPVGVRLAPFLLGRLQIQLVQAHRIRRRAQGHSAYKNRPRKKSSCLHCPGIFASRSGAVTPKLWNADGGIWPVSAPRTSNAVLDAP